MALLSPSTSFGSLPQIGPQRCRLTPSFSMPHITGLDLSHTFGSIVSSWNPNLLSGSLLEHVHVHHPKVSTFLAAFNALRVQFSHLKRRIYGMETENNELKHINMVLRSDSQALEQELSNYRAEYYAELFQSKVRIQCARADKDKIIILNDKLEQAEKFIMAMVDIKLHEPVLGRAAEAVRGGADAEEALIEAVRVAATKKGSAWSRIIPAIVGPRSPEHYLSAINLALMLQKDLHEREKISSFWKKIAQSDPANANTITPSSSLLSEVGGEDVEHSISEQAVLDEMIALLANGDTLSRKNDFISSIPTTDKTISKTMPLTKAPKTANIAGISSPKRINQIPVSPLRPRAKTSQNAEPKLASSVLSPKAIYSTSPTKPLRISSRQPTTPIRKAPLTPIRSRLSTPRTNAFKRPVLTSIDLNRVTKSKSPASISDDTIRKKPSRDHSKNLLKRRGVIMEEISHPRPSIVAENENAVLPMTAEIEIYEPRAPPAKITNLNKPTSTLFSESSLADKESSFHSPQFDLSRENVKHGSLLAAQALQSLERICAAFSSDSLGSLEITDADTDYADDSQSDHEDLRLTNERNSDAVPPTSLADLSHIRKMLHDLECSMASDEDVNLSVAEDRPASGPPRPPTPVVKCSTWASSTPSQHMSSTSATSSSSESPVTVHSKKPFKFTCDKLDISPTPARSPILTSFIPAPKYPTERYAKSLKDTFYKAVPPSQNLSLPINQNPNKGFQQPLSPSQNKSSTFPNVLHLKPAPLGSSPAPIHCKPRSNTINAVSALPTTLSTPKPETLSFTSPCKPRSNTIDTASPIPSTRSSPRPERPMPSTKPRSNTINAILPASRSHTAKTIPSSAKRRSNTLDSYLQVPSDTKSPARTRAVSPHTDIAAPTAAFMRRPDVKTAPVNTHRITNCVTPLIPNWSPVSLHSGV